MFESNSLAHYFSCSIGTPVVCRAAGHPTLGPGWVLNSCKWSLSPTRRVHCPIPEKCFTTGFLPIGSLSDLDYVDGVDPFGPHYFLTESQFEESLAHPKVQSIMKLFRCGWIWHGGYSTPGHFCLPLEEFDLESSCGFTPVFHAESPQDLGEVLLGWLQFFKIPRSQVLYGEGFNCDHVSIHEVL